MMVGDLNANIVDSEGHMIDVEIAVALLDTGLEDMFIHLILRRTSWDQDGQKWSMIRQGRVARSQTEYIIGKYRHRSPA